MRYVVSLAMDGRIDIVVDADDPETAKNKALDKFISVDIGEVECIDYHAVNATDENDNITDF